MTQAITYRARRASLALAVLTGLAACDTATQNTVDAPPEPGVIAATRNGPEGAAEGTCWGKTVSPAVIERVSDKVQLKAAEVNPDGTIATPPRYRTVERQVIVTPRKNNWFETPCPDVLTVEFVSSLQRAMLARGDYGGAITGVMDISTRYAIQLLQRENGPDSGVLSLATARELGLIAVDRATFE